MKKQLLLIVMMLMPMVASADAVEINGIYYNLIAKAKQAEVTSNPNKYTGSVIIPKSVIYNDENYSVTSIDKYAFRSCSGLVSVTIPNSVTSIGESAFQECSRLASVTIPNSVTSIGESAFQECSRLASVTIPNSVTSIGECAFGFCSGLTSVTIPNSVTSIGEGAFVNCSSMTSIIIPNSVTNIGKDTFNGCSGLSSVTIPNSVTSIGNYAFSGCSGITSITIPNSLASIGKYSFRNCSGLTSVTIPNSVSRIGEGAFKNCSSLTSITIGNGLEYINSTAFGSCPNLTDVTCNAENVPNTNSDAFKDSYIEYVTLHVPSASVNAYKTSDPWKNFKEIVAIDGETPTTQKCEKPTISYKNGQLKMSCVTVGVEYVTDITDSDVKMHYDAIIFLTSTYNISVYATKEGYENSETATATLCWIDATLQPEGTTDAFTRIAAHPVLIKTDNGFITVEGIDDKTDVSVYTADGKLAGTAASHNNMATIATNIKPGSIAIVKVSEKSIKVTMK